MQVEYIGAADGLHDGTVEYVTLSGDITTQEGEESRVIGVLRDSNGSLTTDYNTIHYVPYSSLRPSEDPIQAALNTAEVDKVDLMQFQVLNNGDIVYERDIGPPPPLFEDPAIIKVRKRPEFCHRYLTGNMCRISTSETPPCTPPWRPRLSRTTAWVLRTPTTTRSECSTLIGQDLL